jgi:glyoxylase-like metal-dependent hydrolase (beta-lactamase superfamily II)
VRERKLTVEWILDTHPHADHFSANAYLKEKTGARTVIGERVTDVQRLWKDIYNLPPSFRTDGSQWDRLFADGDVFHIGDLEARVLFSPGHTPASVTYVVGDAAFIHDTLFMPDFGTARCDFPGGDAHALWRTIERILALPDHTRLFTGHDYMPNGRPPAWESTVAHQRARNIHLAQAHGEAEFVAPSPRTRRKFADAKAHSARSAGQYRSRTPASRRRQRRTPFEDTAQRACDLSRMRAVSPPNKAP